MIQVDHNDISPADYGYWHESELPDIEHCRSMINALLDQMYYTGQVHCMEQCVEELAAQFDIELPEQSLKIQQNTKNLQQQKVHYKEKNWRDYI